MTESSRPQNPFLDVVSQYRRPYITAVAMALLAFSCSFSIPVVIKNIIDIVLVNQPVNVSVLVGWIINLIGGKSSLIENLWFATLAIIGLYLFFAFFMYFTFRFSGLASESIVRDVRNLLYSKLQKLSYSFFSAEKTGDLIQRCTSDVASAQSFLSNQLTEIGRLIVMVLFLIPFMFAIDVKMALVSLILSPLMVVAVVYYFPNLIRLSIGVEENESEMTSAIQENLAGMKVVRAFARHAFERERFAGKSRDYYRASLRRIDTFARFFSVMTTLAFLQLGLVLVLGSWMVIYQYVSVGTLVAFFSYSSAIAFTLRNLGSVLGETGGAIVAISRINRILNTPSDIEPVNEDSEKQLVGGICFKRVGFSYPGTKNGVEDVTFHVEPGETVAIVGPSGSGKSTIVELLLANYACQTGSIELDGRNLTELNPQSVRSQIGTSLQDVFLFSDTVRTNIKLAVTVATYEEVVTASETARIHDTIQDFPEKYDTVIGENGVDLSGGQRQRMDLARSFIRKPPILILDDSLSAVDINTEGEILQELRRKHDDVTVIIITHRLSCCLNADKILVLENGTITDMGTHGELVDGEGFYRRLWDIQQQMSPEPA